MFAKLYNLLEYKPSCQKRPATGVSEKQLGIPGRFFPSRVIIFKVEGINEGMAKFHQIGGIGYNSRYKECCWEST